MEIKTKIFTMLHQVLFNWQTITKRFTRTRDVSLLWEERPHSPCLQEMQV